ncbi:MAG: Crp/Fnr family transcriptional regulator [Flavobacteriaceae bacterium]
MELSFIQSIYQHPALSQDDYQALMQSHTPVPVRKNDFLLQEGESSNEYYLIEKGLFRAFVTNYNGTEITTHFFGPNELLIEVSSLFQRIPTRENHQALTDGLLWKIDFEDFQQWYHSLAGFNEWGRAWLSNQLFVAKQRSVDMITKSALERYTQLMEEKPQILQTAPLKHIASYLGVTDSSLSRIRKEFSVTL